MTVSVLRAIGFWRSRTWKIHFPHPREILGDYNTAKQVDLLANYLRAGVTVCEQLGYSFCRFQDGPPDAEMGNRDFTDGEWVWPEGLSVYIQKYNVRLPERFVAHVTANNYIVPSILNPEVLLEYHYSYDEWIKWSQRVRSNRILATLSKMLWKEH